MLLSINYKNLLMMFNFINKSCKKLNILFLNKQKMILLINHYQLEI